MEITDCDLALANLIWRGLSIKEIATQMNSTYRSRQVQIDRLKKKLDLPNQAAIAVWYDRKCRRGHHIKVE